MSGAQWRTRPGLLLLAWMIVGWAAVAQEPILTVSFDRDELTIPLGSASTARLRLVNRSVYPADDIELFLLDGDGIEMGTVERVLELRPFSELVLEIPLSVPEGLGEGASDVQFELAHTYCIGDLCFYIFEAVALRVVRTPPSEVTGPLVEPDAVRVAEDPPVDSARPWRMVLPTGLGLMLAGALAATITQRFARAGQVVLLAMGMASLGYGISLQQADQAQRIGAVLCTSCVGIEETPKAPPTLSQGARARIEALEHRVELLLFSAVWCHSCPYAKAMVDQVADATPLITARVVDVDVDRDMADHYGIVQSGRVIVPAILRLDTGELLFGIDRLESRLLSLLEANP